MSIADALRVAAKLAVAALGYLIPVALHAGETLTKIERTGTITLAFREASIPFSYLDDKKRPVGYAIDLCNKIALAVQRELHLPRLSVEYLPVTPATRIASIVEHKADLECGSTTNNAERRKQVAFTIPHFIATARMAVRADSGIRNWPDLRGKRVVTTKGTTTIKLLNDRDKVRSLGLTLIEASDHAQSFAAVEKGDADAFAMDDVLLFGLRAAASNPGQFRIIGDSLSAEAYAIMLARDDAQFKALVDREMSNIIHNGEIYTMYDKWFQAPIPPRQINMHMPMGYLLRENFRYPTDKVND